MTSSDELYIGLDVGRTIRGALVRADGSILRQHRVVSEVSSPRIFVEQLIAVIKELHSGPGEGGGGAGRFGRGGFCEQTAQAIEGNPNPRRFSSQRFPSRAGG